MQETTTLPESSEALAMVLGNHGITAEEDGFRTRCGGKFPIWSLALIHANHCTHCQTSFAERIAKAREEIIARNCSTCRGVEPKSKQKTVGIGKAPTTCKHAISASWFDKLAPEFVKLSELP